MAATIKRPKGMTLYRWVVTFNVQIEVDAGTSSAALRKGWYRCRGLKGTDNLLPPSWANAKAIRVKPDLQEPANNPGDSDAVEDTDEDQAAG